MTLSWRGVNRLFVVSTVLRLAAEGHLIAFGPLQLRELGQSDEEIAVWSGLLFATTTAMSVPLGPFLGSALRRRTLMALLGRPFLTQALWGRPLMPGSALM